MPAVSVIVPAYNAELYIRECLDSLLNQTLMDMEFIVIDDGSTDNTGKIIDEYSKTDDRFRVYHQNNLGLYKTRQRALSYAVGQYIGWVDADDFVKVDMFEKLYLAAIENESELCYCNYAFYPNKIATKEKWFRPYEGNRTASFLERNSQPWNKLVKRELMEQLNIAEGFVACFDEIYIKILLMANNPVSINEVLYYYRMGQVTMSSGYTNIQHYENFVKASINLREEMRSFWEGNVYWEQYFDYREIYYIIMTMLICANAKNKLEYRRFRSQLLDYKYLYINNIHLKNLLIENYGVLKAIAIERFVPSNYSIARLLSILAFH